MAKTKEQLEALRIQRRQTIVKKATLIFAFLAYHEITVDQITRAAGCSHGLFYHYFKSIDELYDEVMRSAVENIESSVFVGLYAARTPKGTLEEAIDRLCSLLNSDNDSGIASLYLLLSNRLRTKDNPHLKKYELKSILATDKLVDLLDKGQKEGVFHEGSAYDMGRCLIALIEGLTFARLYLGKNSFISPDKSIILKLIVKG